jgi:hypothetical protein
VPADRFYIGDFNIQVGILGNLIHIFGIHTGIAAIAGFFSKIFLVNDADAGNLPGQRLACSGSSRQGRQ